MIMQSVRRSCITKARRSRPLREEGKLCDLCLSFPTFSKCPEDRSIVAPSDFAPFQRST